MVERDDRTKQVRSCGEGERERGRPQVARLWRAVGRCILPLAAAGQQLVALHNRLKPLLHSPFPSAALLLAGAPPGQAVQQGGGHVGGPAEGGARRPVQVRRLALLCVCTVLQPQLLPPVLGVCMCLRLMLLAQICRPHTCLYYTHLSLPPAAPAPACRPQGTSKLLQLGLQFPRVVRVRAEWVAPEAKSKQRSGGWALKTKEERILM